MKTCVALCGVLLLASCMSTRQQEAVLVLHDLMRQGVLSPEQFDTLVQALNPETWWQDLLTLAVGLVSGGGAYLATNWRRDRLRVSRGEPVGKVQHAD